MNIPRQPIVTILGHVDHGKTTLLDAIRETSIQKKEAGGITQAIGASVVTLKDGKKITFIDTPGHAAFSAMRSCGSKVCDIAVLVLDASDGVKPQTKEALDHIKKAQIPFLVAITKVDMATASVEERLVEMEKEGIFFEGRGGDTPFVTVSAKEKKGLDQLLDLIVLLSEVSEVSSDPDSDLEAVVIETNKDNAGVWVSVVVRQGKLKVGDFIYAGDVGGKARGIFDSFGKNTDIVLPGQPAKIIGFEDIPLVGAIVKNGKAEKKNREKIFLNISPDKFTLIIKASTLGALDAVVSSIPSDFAIINKGVGDISEGDVLNAKANGALILAFESKISTKVKKLAEMDKVGVWTFNIIYELIQKLEEIAKKGKVEILGKAQVIAEFPFDGKRVAGCKMLSGTISKNSDLRLYKSDVEIGKLKIISLKKQKEEVPSVSQGEEFGVLFVPSLDFNKGDMLISFGGK